MSTIAFRWTALLVSLTLAACSVMPRFPDVPDDPDQAPAEVLLYAQTPKSDELGRLLVPVTVNGSEPLYFLLDTGATHSVLALSAAQKLGLPLNEQAQVLVRGVNGVRRAPTTVVNHFQAGSITTDNWRLPVLGGAIFDDIDGILGSDVLRDVSLTADFLNNEVRISKGAAPPGNARSVINFTNVSRKLVVVDAMIGRVKTRAVIDTGGAHTLANPALLRELMRQSRGKIDGLRGIGIIDATNTSKGALMVRVPRIRIGKASINDLPVAFGRFPVFDLWGINDQPAMLIGMDVLSLMKQLTIDYNRNELLIAQDK